MKCPRCGEPGCQLRAYDWKDGVSRLTRDCVAAREGFTRTPAVEAGTGRKLTP